MDQLSFYLASSMRMAAPLLLTALGLIISERSGIMNIGGEGVMIVGAFASWMTVALTDNLWLGLLVAIVASTAFIMIFAFASITLRAPQVIVGAGINMCGTGLTSFLFRRLFRGETAITNVLTVRTFEPIAIPGLSKIPYIGPLLFNHSLFVYFAFIMVVVVWFIIKKTALGLKIIATGENPKAAESYGIRVIRLRYLAVAFSGVMMGFAGAFLSTSQSNSFVEGMTAGKGFIAMAVVVLAKWNPIGALFGAFLFGAATALQMTVQNMQLNISYNLVMSIPYFITLIAVILVSKNRIAAPSALGVPYKKS